LSQTPHPYNNVKRLEVKKGILPPHKKKKKKKKRRKEKKEWYLTKDLMLSRIG
jgi:predicted ribosome quality control (RQC) complex YloA/Tae2 family protein